MRSGRTSTSCPTSTSSAPPADGGRGPESAWLRRIPGDRSNPLEPEHRQRLKSVEPLVARKPLEPFQRGGKLVAGLVQFAGHEQGFAGDEEPRDLIRRRPGRPALARKALHLGAVESGDALIEGLDGFIPPLARVFVRRVEVAGAREFVPRFFV